jgi:hypothetical protein
VAKDRLALMPGLWKMKGKRYLVIFYTRNGDKLLLGRVETPATALVSTRTSGEDPDQDRNQYDIAFALTRRLPVPFYQGTPPEPTEPGDCPTLCTQIAAAEPEDYASCIVSSGHLAGILEQILPSVEPENVEAQVLDQLSPEQLEAAEASLCEVPADGTVKTTDGGTTVLTVAPGATENLPQSTIKYRNLSNVASELAASNTEFGGGVLKAATEIPRRALRNSAGTGFNFVHVGQLVDDTVPTMPDSTITRPDGTTVSNPAGVALDVRNYRSGIVYNFGYILASGQTVSYRTGDEGSYRSAGFFNYTRPVYPLAYAALDNGTWATLASNNIHGNTLRFTNRSGGAAATSGNRVIQDHWTGLEWYIPSSLPAVTTWNAAIDAAEASTVESSTDWMIPTDRILDTISRDDQANPLNISPFNLGTTLEFWTSTTDPSDTTQARRCVNAAGGGLFGRAAKGANNASYIFCRKFI